MIGWICPRFRSESASLARPSGPNSFRGCPGSGSIRSSGIILASRIRSTPCRCAGTDEVLGSVPVGSTPTPMDSRMLPASRIKSSRLLISGGPPAPLLPLGRTRFQPLQQLIGQGADCLGGGPPRLVSHDGQPFHDRLRKLGGRRHRGAERRLAKEPTTHLLAGP